MSLTPTPRQVLERRTTSGRAFRPGKVHVGCLVAIAVVLALIVGVVIWIAVSWKGWVAEIGRASVTQMVQDSQLPPDQKSSIIARVDKLTDDFKAGRVNGDQLARVVEELTKTPLLHLGFVYILDQKYIAPSSLSKEEKDAGRIELQRVARGVFEEKIPRKVVDDIMAPVSTKGPNGELKLKDNATADEVRAFIALAKSRADAANIPNEPYNVDVAAEVNKAIDAALGQTAPAPAPPPAPPGKK